MHCMIQWEVKDEDYVELIELSIRKLDNLEKIYGSKYIKI
jgi:hypothetical protein